MKPRGGLREGSGTQRGRSGGKREGSGAQRGRSGGKREGSGAQRGRSGGSRENTGGKRENYGPTEDLTAEVIFTIKTYIFMFFILFFNVRNTTTLQKRRRYATAFFRKV